MKIDKLALGVDALAEAAVSSKVSTEDDGWTKFERILGSITELLKHYETLKNPNKSSSLVADNASINNAPINNAPINTVGGFDVKEVLGWLISFCENLESQGLGDKPIGEVIASIPLPVKTVTQLLHAVKAKMLITGKK